MKSQLVLLCSAVLIASCSNPDIVGVDVAGVDVSGSVTADSTIVPGAAAPGDSSNPAPGNDVVNQDTTTPPSQPGQPAATIPEAPTDELESGPITVLVDGWSYASMDHDALIYVSNDTFKRVTLRPVSAGDLANIASRDIAAVEAVAARMVSAEASLQCSAEQCAGQDWSISFDDMVNPANIDGYGASYSGYSIDATLYAAVLAGDSGELRYGDSIVPVARTTQSVNDDDTLDDVVDTSVTNISVAFGQMFKTTPTWLESNGAYNWLVGGTSGAGGNEIVDAFVDEPGVLFNGLGATVDAAAALGASQLTFFSSPTTGCGVGVLCVPGRVQSAPVQVTSQFLEVCSDGSAAATVVFARFDATFNYQAPTHQAGLWGGEAPAAGVLWATPAPLVSGETLQRHALAYLVSGDKLVSVRGLTTQPGVDDEEVVNTVLGAQHLERLFGSDFVPCA